MVQKTLHHKVTLEQELLDYLEELAPVRESYRALYLHFSRLHPEKRQDHHIRLAVDNLNHLLQTHQGKVISLSNKDVIFFCQGVPLTAIDETMACIRALFQEDPHLYGDDTQDRLLTTYDLDRHYYDLLAIAHKMAQYQRALADGQIIDRRQQRRYPIDSKTFAEAVEAIKSANFMNLITDQPVCLVHEGGGQLRPVLREIYTNLRELQRVYTPTINITSNRWLFQYLSKILDGKLLDHVAKKSKDIKAKKNISINLNISTILSSHFSDFDKAIPDAIKSTIMIEVQLMDIFLDMGAFIFAREWLHQRGYKIAIDGLTHQTLPLVDRAAFGVDYLKFYWHPELMQDPLGEQKNQLLAKIKANQPEKIIMARCDHPDAVQFGLRTGIKLFQGHHVDQLLRSRLKLPEIKSVNV